MGNSKNMINICKLKYHYVYQTKNLINRKTYIGRHSTDDLNDKYIGSGKMLKRAIKKYGKENFECIPMCYFDTYEESVEEEKYIVTREYCKSKNNYNIVEGGSNPIMYAEMNPSWKGGLAKYIKKGRKLLYGKEHPNYGRIVSEEQKNKQKQTRIQKGFCVEVTVDDQIFKSRQECADFYKISESTANARCVSPHFKNWKYVNDGYQKEREITYYKKVEKRKLKNKLLKDQKMN